MEMRAFPGDRPYRVTRKGEVKKTSWPGGTTSQLFILPGDADLGKRDFTFRVSTASVDVERSTFTPFEGFDRIIMTIDNDLALSHDGGEEVTLKKFEPHLFDGGAETRSRGKVRDFNCIMDRKTCRGEITAMTLARGSVLYPRKGNYGAGLELEIIYCAAGRLTFRYGETEERLDQGDVLAIDHGLMDSRYRLSNEQDQPCDLVVTLIRSVPPVQVARQAPHEP
ncbi:MAG: HutD [Synergistetes bacterium ADurb.Bin155]|jgi:environmental stress-induced protein Ves|nr:HutD family protein [Synergistales bacterium]NMD17944.1 HutD family protein [Synergistaceae bacterium]OQB46737.1 MAG: HutD [Synergistetes bacterium ADurb.Bin155]HOC81670.1 HutD family protein [Synergistales bacterium]HQL02092.1 HutD family protein [Synergistales bacterium]